MDEDNIGGLNTDTKELQKEINKLQRHLRDEINRLSTAFSLSYIEVELIPSQFGKKFIVQEDGVKIKVAWQDKID